MSELWVEKYRPTDLEELIADEDTLSKFQKMIDEKDIPHLLFSGSAGIGKTTAAKILANKISEEICYINASDRSSVETIRDEVSRFCSSISFSGDLKIIILDEFDGMSDHAMRMLRGTMEEFHKTARFILTCNFEHKIIEAINSRCQTFDFGKATMKQVAQRCLQILKNENVSSKGKKEDIMLLVKKHFPDIRKIVNMLQKNCVDGEFNFMQEAVTGDDKDRLIDLLKGGDIRTIRKELLGPGTDWVGFYTTLFDRVGEYAGEDKATPMLIVEDYFSSRHPFSLHKEITFVGCLLQLWKVI